MTSDIQRRTPNETRSGNDDVYFRNSRGKLKGTYSGRVFVEPTGCGIATVLRHFWLGSFFRWTAVGGRNINGRRGPPKTRTAEIACAFLYQNARTTTICPSVGRMSRRCRFWPSCVINVAYRITFFAIYDEQTPWPLR